MLLHLSREIAFSRHTMVFIHILQPWFNELLLNMAELVNGEKGHSDWFPERPIHVSTRTAI